MKILYLKKKITKKKLGHFLGVKNDRKSLILLFFFFNLGDFPSFLTPKK